MKSQLLLCHVVCVMLLYARGRSARAKRYKAKKVVCQGVTQKTNRCHRRAARRFSSFF